MATLIRAFLGAILLSLPTQAYSASNWIVHETVPVPSGWKAVGPANDATVTKVSISLSQPRMGELRRRLDRVSDIQDRDLGAHLSRDQLHVYQRPTDEAVGAVGQWLGENGVKNAVLEGSWVHFNASVGLLNSLLRCNLSAYNGPRSRLVLRAPEYSLPRDLIEHIQFIHPLTQFAERSTENIYLQSRAVESVTTRQAQQRKTSLPSQGRYDTKNIS